MKQSALIIAFSAILAVTLPTGDSSAKSSEKQTIKTLSTTEPAPDLSLTDLDGESRKLSDYRGQVVAVNFWATWCPPCREELPSMQRTYDALRDKGLVILGVNVGESWDTVAPFLEDFGLTYPILLDKDSAAMGEWKIMGLPTTYIVDRQGRITHRITGGRDWDDAEFRTHLTEIVEQSAGN